MDPPRRAVFRISSGDEAVVVSVAGEVDLVSAPRLEAALAAAAAAGPAAIVVELDQLGFIDAAGVSVLLEAATDCRSRGRAFALRAVPPLARRVIELLGGDPGLLVE